MFCRESRQKKRVRSTRPAVLDENDHSRQCDAKAHPDADQLHDVRAAVGREAGLLARLKKLTRRACKRLQAGCGGKG
jgi:hypothetical protein